MLYAADKEITQLYKLVKDEIYETAIPKCTSQPSKISVPLGFPKYQPKSHKNLKYKQ